jgi:cytochrome c
MRTTVVASASDRLRGSSRIQVVAALMFRNKKSSATAENNRKGDRGMLGYRTLAVLALVLAAENALAQEARAQRGRTLAQANCASCHAIGRVGESPLRIAPPFRMLHARYPVENLAEAFAEGIVTGHPTMPQFRFDPAQIGDLLAYLKTLEH